MATRVALHHVTRYTYDRLVGLSPHVVRLRPAPHCRTPVEAYSLRISPEPHFLNWQQDPFGNYQARLVFPEPAKELIVEVDLVVEMTVVNPFDFFLEKYAEHYPFAYEPSLSESRPYLEKVPNGPLFAEFVERVRTQDARAGRRMVDVLVDINRRVQSSLKYDIRHGAGGVRRQRNAGAQARLVSRFRVALGAGAPRISGSRRGSSRATRFS